MPASGDLHVPESAQHNEKTFLNEGGLVETLASDQLRNVFGGYREYLKYSGMKARELMFVGIFM